MPVLTHDQVIRRNLNSLLARERVLETELKRLGHGLRAVQEQIAKERRALAGASAATDTGTGQRAA